ncbi:unnamed protein product [Porites lobata]|uniref:MSP domain-containing protein n=1 Tax=Porites lobata TaxID=104759 RepID=A0ABN8PDK5_9CNID|nr:unnamed protein product [Porites lobata]
MSKAEQVLKLEPASELRFRGSFTKVVTANLKLTNPTEKKVCFKVKTTAPKRYCVRPNSGFVEPTGVVEVAVMLQPFEYDPKEKSKHKFMVQTMFAPEGQIDHETLWKEADQSAFMDSKLKCVFDYVDESEAPVDSSMGGNENESLNNREVPLPSKISKVEPAPVDSGTSNIKTASSHNRNGSYPEPGVEASTSTRSLQADERRTINEELEKLKNENTVLMEETLRLRKNVTQLPSPAEASSASVTTVPSPQQQQQQTAAANMPPVAIAYLVIALICGIIIGKFLL